MTMGVPNPTPVAFARLRELLNGLRYKERCTEKTLIFQRSSKNRFFFRRYKDSDTIEWGDVVRTRKLLNKRRIVDEDFFDAFLRLTIKRSRITFAEFRWFLEPLGYRHRRHEKGEVFFQGDRPMLMYPRYYDQEFVSLRDLASARSFLDAWGQMEAADFDAFLESTTKPA
jgi:hypothetical protein